jgi:hypothetical protein
MRQEPGKDFYYCTGASHLLAAILQQTTGKSAFEYAEEKLFAAMGIKDIYWMSDCNGINIGGAGMFMTPSDMAKFGYLYLKRGNWDGRQIVPEQWIETSTQKQINTPYGLAGRYGYGYHWWMNRFGGYSARGFGGQYIFVLPQYEMVVVFTSGLSGSDFFLPENIVESFIIPAVKSAALKPNVDNEENLAKVLKAVSQQPVPKPIPSMPVSASRISGKKFAMEDSSSLSFLFSSGKECRLDITVNGTKYEIPVGLDDVYRIADLSNFGPLPSNRGAFKGGWMDEKTFVITFRGLEDTDELKFYYSFDGDKIKVSTYSKMAGTIVSEVKGNYGKLTGCGKML